MRKRTIQKISRRSVILGAAALSADCAAQGTSRIAAPATTTRTGVDTTVIEQVLHQAIGRNKVAGLVATAATDKGTFYEAAYGKRSLDRDTDMNTDSVSNRGGDGLEPHWRPEGQSLFIDVRH
jgi:hypothetical protein